MRLSQKGLLALVRSFDLRFEEALEEEAFAISLERHRLLHIVLMGLSASLVTCWISLGMVHKELRQDDARLRWDTWDGRWTIALIGMAVFPFEVALVVVAAGRLRRRGRCCGQSEHLVFVLYVPLFIWISFCRHHQVMTMLGDLDSTWSSRVGGGYANAVLGFVTMITSVCQSNALRFHRLVILMSLCWTLWFASFLVAGSEESNATPAVTLLVLLVLHLFGLQGAWRNERFVRRQWRQLEALREQSAMACGMQAVAERFCTFVLSLRDDLRVCVEGVGASHFFGRPSLGVKFVELVVESDVDRVNTVFSQASSTNIPMCLQVALSVAEGPAQASLFIAVTGASNPKYIVGVTVEQATTQCIDARIRDEVRAGLDDRLADTVIADDAGSTLTCEIFRDLSLKVIADLGRDERWRIPADELRLPLPACILGRGGFGVVVAGVLHGRAAAIKTVPQGARDQRCLRALLDELRVLRRIKHPNVVLFYGAVVEPGPGSVALVYELIRGVQLDVVARRAEPTALNRFKMMYDVGCALMYLHSQTPPIAHSDLKGSNVMVEELRSGLRAKVIDFGMSRFMAHGTRAGGGSLGWSPPERFTHRDGADDVSSDVFSFGWLVHLALTGEGPHENARGEALQAAVSEMLLSGTTPAPRVPQATRWRGQCEALCRECLAFDAAARPTMEAVQQRLKGWLGPDELVALDFASAAAMLDSVGWLEGEQELPTVGEEEASCAQIDFDASDGFHVTFSEAADAAVAELLPEAGANFLDWLSAPDNFEIITQATLNDIRSGILAAPLVQSVSGLDLRPPAGNAPIRRSSGFALFAPQIGMVSLRLHASFAARHAGSKVRL